MNRKLIYIYFPAMNIGRFFTNSSEKPTYGDLGKGYSNLWLFICGISAIFLVMCILAARFFPTASELLTFGLVFITLLLLGFIFWNRNNEPEGHFWESFLLGVLVTFGVSYALVAITKNFSIITWSLIPTNSLFPSTTSITQSVLTPMVPNTIHLSFLSLTTDQAKSGLALFFNIPGPFAEEMGFRVFMWKIAAPLIGKNKAILFQAAGFGGLHYFAYGANWINVFVAVIVGLGLGAIYAKYQDELGVGLAHFTFNISSMIVAILLGVAI